MRNWLRLRPAELVAIAVMAALTGFAGAARAACEGEVLFADNFVQPNDSWSPRDVTVFRNGKYVMTLERNVTVQDFPADLKLSGDYTVCVQMKLPNDPMGAAGSGLLFWLDPAKNAIGSHDYYMAVASPDGYYWVSRLVNGNRSAVLNDMQGPLIKTGPNDVNELAVTVKGGAGIFLLNGKEVGRFSGQPPRESHAGIMAGSPLDQRYVVEFMNFRVVRP